jgi:outer membrane protein assembly factor BamB
MTKTTAIAAKTLFLLLILAPHFRGAMAEDWPHWRGPTRNSHSSEPSGYNGEKWLETRPLWTANVGEGSTSPVVIGERLYVLGWREARDRLSCRDAATGKAIWTKEYDSPRHARHATGDEGLYSGPTATPEYDPQTRLLYTLGSNGDLICWNTADSGSELWKLNLYDRYQVEQRPKIKRSGLRDYGYTASPLVFNDWLLVEVGSDEGTVMAFDKRTGQQVWASEYRGEAGHSGAPVLMTVESVPCAAMFTLRQLVVMRLDEGQAGQTIATHDWETEWANNILTPTVVGSDVLIGSYHTHHATARMHITLAGAKEIWKQPFASHVGSPVVHKDQVYLCGAQLNCLDWNTGELQWKGGSFGDGGACVLTADERLVVLSSKGDLSLIETAGRADGQYKELARLGGQFQTEAWCHPILAGGRVYAKDRAGNLKCFASAP